jgi:hypothetical protein
MDETKIFNITIRVLYSTVFNQFIYENQFVTKINTYIKFIEKNQRKKNLYARLYILKILLKNKCFFILKNKFNSYKIK